MLPVQPVSVVFTMSDHIFSKGLVYLLTNFLSACGIVFANKAVLSLLHFKWTVALTCIHTIATMCASLSLRAMGVITPKRLPTSSAVALAGAFTGYIILCNVSLYINTVGFYQLTKIAIAPTVLVLEAWDRRRVPELNVTTCVLVVCSGIGLATVFDTQVMTNLPGIFVGVLSVLVSAQYGMWIGSLTKRHEVSPIQLLDQYLPHASLMMVACVPIESMILHIIGPRAQEQTLLSFAYNARSVGLISLSALLGVLVTFSTFLVIGHTSALTYAIAGHVKTIAILMGGILMFGDRMPVVKATGIALALGGVIAYTNIKLSANRDTAAAKS